MTNQNILLIRDYHEYTCALLVINIYKLSKASDTYIIEYFAYLPNA